MWNGAKHLFELLFASFVSIVNLGFIRIALSQFRGKAAISYPTPFLMWDYWGVDFDMGFNISRICINVLIPSMDIPNFTRALFLCFGNRQ